MRKGLVRNYERGERSVQTGEKQVVPECLLIIAPPVPFFPFPAVASPPHHHVEWRISFIPSLLFESLPLVLFNRLFPISVRFFLFFHILLSHFHCLRSSVLSSLMNGRVWDF